MKLMLTSLTQLQAVPGARSQDHVGEHQGETDLAGNLPPESVVELIQRCKAELHASKSDLVCHELYSSFIQQLQIQRQI